MLVKLVLLILILTAGHVTHAGWMIVERTREEGQSAVFESTLYIQDNVIKSVGPDQTMIIDLNRWKLTLVSPAHNGYWSGTPGEYMKFVKEVTLEYLEKEISIADDDQKPFLQALLEDLKLDMQLQGDVVSFMGELTVDIVMTDRTDRMLGLQVNQFQVFVDGTNVEELWLTRDTGIADHYDYQKFRAFMDGMSWGNMFQDYRSSDKYIHLMKAGFPLRTIESGENGSVRITEVVRVESIDIPEADFAPPSHYKPVSLSVIEQGLF